jgi:hypothetical protein
MWVEILHFNRSSCISTTSALSSCLLLSFRPVQCVMSPQLLLYHPWQEVVPMGTTHGHVHVAVLSRNSSLLVHMLLVGFD